MVGYSVKMYAGKERDDDDDDDDDTTIFAAE
jgi:hypothetical protein